MFASYWLSKKVSGNAHKWKVLSVDVSMEKYGGSFGMGNMLEAVLMVREKLDCFEIEFMSYLGKERDL